MWLAGRGIEPSAGCGCEENPDKQDEKYAVDEQLSRFVQADGDVECYPDDGEPARPVVPAEEEDADDHSQEFRKLDPNGVGLTHKQAVEMRGETEKANHEIKAGEQSDGDGPVAHVRKGSGRQKGPCIFPWFSWRLTWCLNWRGRLERVLALAIRENRSLAQS